MSFKMGARVGRERESINLFLYIMRDFPRRWFVLLEQYRVVIETR